MGFFFRRSTGFGPFRLNFSKSGVGASFGVKGARLTMKPNGTTYVTVGSHGFYYRETLSQGGRRIPGSAPPPQQPTPAGSDSVPTADVTQLVDSSSEKLIAGLNKRAKMHDPSWTLYLLSAFALITGLWKLSETPQPPDLPDVSSLLFNSERQSNSRDEYSMLVVRYGQPDTVLVAKPLGLVPVRKAGYNGPGVTIILVPNGCVETYRKTQTILPDVTSHPSLAKMELKGVTACAPAPVSGWTIVDYDASSDAPISAAVAKSLFANITSKREMPPAVKAQSPPPGAQIPGTRSSPKKNPEMKAEVQPNKQALAAELEIQRDAETSVNRTQNLAFSLFAGSAIALFGGIVVHRRNNAKRSSRLVFELDEKESRKFGAVQETIGHLASCRQIWRVEGQSATSDWKRNAGASSLVRRKPISVGRSSPPRVEVNLPIPFIGLSSSELYFLPDTILYRERSLFGSISYDDLKMEQHLTTFVEDQGVLGDTNVVGSTWRYVNKNGGPDRRFSNNAQLPVVQYGVLTLKSSRGLNIHLYTSNAQASFAVAKGWKELNGNPQTTKSSSSASQRHNPARGVAEALQVLGLKAGATPEEITTAYHRLAQMYHPDKVSGLGPELQSLADQKMREINEAYRLLRESGP